LNLSRSWSWGWRWRFLWLHVNNGWRGSGHFLLLLFLRGQQQLTGHVRGARLRRWSRLACAHRLFDDLLDGVRGGGSRTDDNRRGCACSLSRRLEDWHWHLDGQNVLFLGFALLFVSLLLLLLLFHWLFLSWRLGSTRARCRLLLLLLDCGSLNWNLSSGGLRFLGLFDLRVGRDPLRSQVLLSLDKHLCCGGC